MRLWSRDAGPKRVPFTVSPSSHGTIMGLVETGRWNWYIGWALVVAGFAWAAWLDPWSLAEHDAAYLPSSTRMPTRHAQAVVLAMAFLQLLVAELLAAGFPARAPQTAAGLTGAGAVLYTAGYVLGVPWPAAVWLVPAGALLNFAGLATLLGAGRGGTAAAGARVVLPVLCLGMLLDAAMGLFAADPAAFRPDYLGPDDGVRLRLLRLARTAVTALSVLATLYAGLAVRGGAPPWARRGQLALWCGVLGMPAILTAAAFTDLRVKYLLPLPSLATFVGVCAGAWLAHRLARPLESSGWVLVVASIGVGLLMGLYAFDGPAPTPPFLGQYNDWPRRLSRLGHAYCIVLGLLSIFLARARPEGPPRPAGLLLAGGIVATLLNIALVALTPLPTAFLAPGPAVVALATVLCLTGRRGQTVPRA